MLRARVAEARLAMLLLTRIPVGYLRDPIPATGASAWGWPLAGAVAMLPAGLTRLITALAFPVGSIDNSSIVIIGSAVWALRLVVMMSNSSNATPFIKVFFA